MQTFAVPGENVNATPLEELQFDPPEEARVGAEEIAQVSPDGDGERRMRFAYEVPTAIRFTRPSGTIADSSVL